MIDTQQMPKKKTAKMVRKLKAPKRPAIAPVMNRSAAPTLVSRDTAAAADLSPFPATFENKAGRYELIRIDGDQAYYSFVNLQNKTVDATMSVITWRKMQERALAALKETA
jgi:hypothetical protein